MGPDPACRQRLIEFQQAVLTRRAEMLPLLDAVATDKGTSFDVLGREQALEYMTLEMPFLFWQYGSASDCARIPGTSEKAQVIFDFLDEISDVYSYSDGDIDTFLPYYHQSATQLGYPTDDESQLMLKYPGGDTARAYIPAAIPTPDYDQGAAMIDVQSWLKSTGSRVLLIYGQYDPWSAGALELGAARDSFRFYVPEGNHLTAKLMALPEDDRRVALDAVARWAATPVQEPPPKYKSVGAPRTVERDGEDSMPRYRM